MATLFPLFPSTGERDGAIAPSSSHLTLWQRIHRLLQRGLLAPLRHWLDTLPLTSARQAHLICRLIPANCPFERTLTLFGHTLIHIPPLCKLNPLYDEFIALRFRALSYLADEWGDDITPYLH